MIELSTEGAVAEIAINAPGKLNALDEEAVLQLRDAYTEAAQAGVRALVLRGKGRAFRAGRDISHVDPRTDNVIDYLGGLVQPLMRQMSEFPTPAFTGRPRRVPGSGPGPADHQRRGLCC